MLISIENHSDYCSVIIEDEMTIYHATEIKEKLMEVLMDNRDLEVDLSKVNEIDSSGIQLLMLLYKEQVTRNKMLKLINHSQSVLDVFKLMNLISYFNDVAILSASLGESNGS